MLLRRVARPLLAGIFIQGGVAALRDPKPHADLAAPVAERVAQALPIDEPPSATAMVRIDAGVKIGAGTLLALGRAPRLSAAMLAATVVPTTVAGHRFWEVEDPNQRANDQIHFMKNLGLLGGLMLAAADTEGRPSLAWRARRAGRTSAATAELFHQDVSEGLGHLSERAGEAATRGGEVATRAGEKLAPIAARAGERTGQLLTDAEAVAGHALEQARRSKTYKESRKAVKKARKRAAKRADQLRSDAEKRAKKVRADAEKRAKVVRANAERQRKLALANAEKLRSEVRPAS